MISSLVDCQNAQAVLLCNWQDRGTQIAPVAAILAHRLLGKDIVICDVYRSALFRPFLASLGATFPAASN